MSEGQIAEHILLATNLGLDVTCMTELLFIPLRVGLPIVGRAASLVCDVHELGAIVGTASLEPRTEGREFHAAKGLTVHDGSCDASVYVKVASHHVVLPILLLLLIQRLQAGGQAIIKAVDEFDGFLQSVVWSDGKEGCKQLGAEGEGGGFHVNLNCGLEDVLLLIHKFRRNEPLLAWLKFERLFQFLVAVGNHRTHNVASVPHTAHLEGGCAVFEFFEELRVVVNGALHQKDGTSGTFLAGIAECAAAGIHYGVVAVAFGGENHHVLAACLGRERLARILMSQRLCCLRATCQDDMLHYRGRGQQRGGFLVCDDYLKRLFGYAGIPECFGKEPGNRSGHSGGQRLHHKEWHMGSSREKARAQFPLPSYRCRGERHISSWLWCRIGNSQCLPTLPHLPLRRSFL